MRAHHYTWRALALSHKLNKIKQTWHPTALKCIETRQFVDGICSLSLFQADYSVFADRFIGYCRSFRAFKKELCPSVFILFLLFHFSLTRVLYLCTVLNFIIFTNVIALKPLQQKRKMWRKMCFLRRHRFINSIPWNKSRSQNGFA